MNELLKDNENIPKSLIFDFQKRDIHTYEDVINRYKDDFGQIFSMGDITYHKFVREFVNYLFHKLSKKEKSVLEKNNATIIADALNAIALAIRKNSLDKTREEAKNGQI